MYWKGKIISINQLRKSNINKRINYIDSNFKLTFKCIIDKKLKSYNGIPISWEDIYYSFLYEVSSLVDKFDENKNITFKTFLGIQCNFFASNMCRKYSSNKYKTLNVAITTSDDIYLNNLKDTSSEVKVPLDISSLSSNELFIFNSYFLDGSSITKISNNNNFTRYKIRKLIISIKNKLSSQIKN